MDGLLQLLSCIQQGWNLWLVKIIFVFPDTVDCFPNFCFPEKLWAFKASVKKLIFCRSQLTCWHENWLLLWLLLYYWSVLMTTYQLGSENHQFCVWCFSAKQNLWKKFHCVKAPSFSMPSKPHIQVIFAWQIQSHFEMTIESLYWKVCPSVFQVSRWKLQGGNYKVAF